MGGKRCAGLGLLLAPILLLFALARERRGSASSPGAASTCADNHLARRLVSACGRGSAGRARSASYARPLTQAFTDYEDRIAFGLVAFGHRGGGACTEAELLAKPGELSAKSPGKLLFGAGFKPKATKPVAAALVEAAKQTPATGLDVVLITDGPRHLQGQCLRHGEIAEASGAGLAHSCHRLRPQGEANRQGSCLRGEDHRGPVPDRCQRQRPEARP